MVLGDNLTQMRAKIPTKQQTMLEISQLLGTPEIVPTTGSTIPSAFFTSVAAEMGVPIIAGMPNMARKIIEAVQLEWHDRFSSEKSPSGGGGTVTALGLLQVKNAVLVWQGQQLIPLPDEVLRDEWIPQHNWQEIRNKLPRETKTVFARPGADKFRELVLSEYDNQCAVTGVQINAVIEVAHIVPYFGQESDQVQNAIPLRIDIHRLFDAGLIKFRVNPTLKLEVVIHDLAMDDYSEYHLKELMMPKDPLSSPSSAALAEHDKLFENLWRSI